MAELIFDVVVGDEVDVTVVNDLQVDISAVPGDVTVVEIPGPRGPRGFDGEQGIQGIQGIQGNTGPTGPAGTIAVGQVSTGIPGSSAAITNVGSPTAAVLNFTVPQGPQGVAGTPGQRGDTGSTGAQGIQGLQGERGEKGDTGATGAQGAAGIQGIPGVKGDTGATGPVGPTGAQGNPGVSLDIQGSVATYADLPSNAQPGDAWIVLSSGKLYYRDATGFPADGDGVPFQGPQGIQGIQGIQGERGDTGSTGPQGIQGERGDTGSAGPTGSTGAQGIQGLQGLPGQDGRGFTWRGEFSSSDTYAVDDVAGFGGSTYLCLIGGTTQSPVAAPSRWALMALRGDTGATGATGPQGAAGTTSWSGITDVPSTLVYTDAAQTLTQKTFRFSDGVPAVTHATNGNLLQFSTIASGDSYIEIANNLLGTAPRVSAVGSATNVPIAIGSKGVGNIFFRANSSANSFAVTSAVSSGSVNYLQANQVAAGGTPSFSVAGSADANVSINLVPKGTGTVQANGVPILTRSIQTVTSAITLGNNQNTDYVAFIGASGSVTLPTAVGNTSRYTIKCIDSASKTVSSTSSQTIDGATTYTLAQNVSIDLVSDGSNWRIV